MRNQSKNTAVPDIIINNPELDANEQLTYMSLLSFSDSNDHCVVTNNELSSHPAINKDSLDSLESKGFIKIEPTSNNRRTVYFKYTVNGNKVIEHWSD